jgi:signal peptidase I
MVPLSDFPLNRTLTGTYPYIVDGPSMAPTLNYNDRFIVNHNNKQLKRDDIVIFKAPEGKTYVKRIVGIEGDTVEINNNMLIINDKPVQEPYLENQEKMMDFEKITVPANSYFTLGDNRNNSHDSRAIGPTRILG